MRVQWYLYLRCGRCIAQDTTILLNIFHYGKSRNFSKSFLALAGKILLLLHTLQEGVSARYILHTEIMQDGEREYDVEIGWCVPQFGCTWEISKWEKICFISCEGGNTSTPELLLYLTRTCNFTHAVIFLHKNLVYLRLCFQNNFFRTWRKKIFFRTH